MTITALFATTMMTLHPAPATMLVQSADPATREDLGNGLYALIGRGGNIVFSTGRDGTFVIDDQFADNAASNISLIREVDPKAIVFVLNTHHHGDHAGGNSTFAKAGATIVAQDNVRTRLQEEVSEGKIDVSALPSITFSDTSTFHWNDRDMKLTHIPHAHTDGDAMIQFLKANVIHTGDIMFSGRYPYIDLSADGSVDGVIAGLKQIYELADENTVIVPGHGPISTREDVKKAYTLLEETRALVCAEMMKGLDRDAVIAAAPLAKFDETYAWAFIDGPKMTGILFDDLMNTDSEAKAAVEQGPAPMPVAAPGPSMAPAMAPAPVPATMPAPMPAPMPAQAPHTDGMSQPQMATPAPVTPEPAAITPDSNAAPAPTPAAPDAAAPAASESALQKLEEAASTLVEEAEEFIEGDKSVPSPAATRATDESREQPDDQN